MEHKGPALRAKISGKEHTSDYATENAQAFIEMGKAVADTYSIDYEEFRVPVDNHCFIIEEKGRRDDYILKDFTRDLDEELEGESPHWEKSVSLSGFEKALNRVINEPYMELHGVSEILNGEPASIDSQPVETVSTGYGDASMPLATEDKEVNTWFKGAPNSGIPLEASILQKTYAGLKSTVSTSSTTDILAEKNQSGQEPYAELYLIEKWEYENGLDPIEETTLEKITDHVSGFEVEYIEPNRNKLTGYKPR